MDKVYSWNYSMMLNHIHQTLAATNTQSGREGITEVGRDFP